MNYSRHNNRVVEVARSPCFHTHGLDSRRGPFEIGPRSFDPNQILQFSRKHRLDAWREKEFNNIVHVNDYTAMKMGKIVQTYFENIWKI